MNKSPILRIIKSPINRSADSIQRYFSTRAIKDSIANLPATKKGPFFLIVMPGGLHIADLCLRHVPDDINVVVILNGVTKWEGNWAVKHWKPHSMIRLPFRLSHGTVLDELFENFTFPFGILDCDCFVFNPSLFYQIQELDDKMCMRSAFPIKIPSLNLEMPQTFFLFFNTPIINNIKRAYKVKSSVVSWKELSPIVQKRLIPLGVSENNTPAPPNIRNCFDTLQLIMLLCIAAGYSVGYVKKSEDVLESCYHVGGGSRVGSFSSTSLWNIRGAYFWRRALDTSPYGELKNYYDRLWKLTPEQILDLNPNSRKIKDDFFRIIELVVKRNNP